MRARNLPLAFSFTLALPLLAALAAAHAQATDGSGAVSIGERRVAPGLLPNWSLSIQGHWATQCPPTLETVTLDDHDLRVDARSVLELCERGSTPFSIEVNPALALNRGPLAPGIYRVSFYAADGAQASPKLRAFTLVDHSTQNTPAVVPETGFWWSTSASDVRADRTTLSLELQDGQLSAALLSYDDLGQPVWYFGAGAFAGHIAHLSLLRLAGGSAPFAQVSTLPHGEAGLTMDLEFSSAAHASAWLTRAHGGDGLQLETLDLVRLPLADSASGEAWQGDWVLVADAKDATPQRLHFDQYRAVDAEHFQIEDTNAKVGLVCSRKPAQPEWPPAACSLRQDEGALLGDFSSVALARMDGQRADRVSLHLLRITR